MQVLRRTRALYWSVLLLIFLPASLAAFPDEEAQDEIEVPFPDRDDQTTRNPKEKRFDARLWLGVAYDDNILNLRDDTLDDFESGDFPEGRFLIDSADDFVVNPGLQLSYSIVPETRRRNRIRLTMDGARYVDNSIKDFESYRLEIDKDLTDTRDDLTGITLDSDEATQKRIRTIRSFRLRNRSNLRARYRYRPTRYLGQLRDDDDFREFKKARLSADSWELRGIARLNTGDENRFALELGYGQGERDYNPDFDERDSDDDELWIGGHWYSLGDRAYWESALLFYYVDLDANADLVGQTFPGGTIEDDVSYDAGTLRAWVGRHWYRETDDGLLRKQDRWRLMANWRDKDYTTEHRTDLSHFGRTDERWNVNFWYSRALTDKSVLDFGVAYTQQDSSLDEIIGVERNEPSAYEKWVFAVRYNIYFGWRKKPDD